MESIFGTVSHVRRSAAVYGNQQGVDTVQMVTFRIGSRAVEIALPDPPQIDEGDEVAVVGDVRNGTLKARAYVNRSNGAYNRRKVASNSWICLIMLLVFGLIPNVGGIFLLMTPFTLIWWGVDLARNMKNRRALRQARACLHSQWRLMTA